MYEAYFGLRDTPFSITPDPRFVFMSRRHAEALAHLRYGIEAGGGFIQLTGEVGTGKTLLIRCLLEQLPPGIDAALIINPGLDGADFLRAIGRELHLATPAQAGRHALMQQLNQHLLESHAAGRRTVLIVDEAQALPPDTLEQIRLLTNLETASAKLLQIVLVGQPELRDTLAREDLRQLAQRITGRYHLDALSRSELDHYIRHRLEVAGAPGRIFSPAAVRRVHRVSQGIPRLANVLCDRALLGAYTRERRRVTPGLVSEAARQLAHPAPRHRRVGRLWPVLALLPAVAVAAGAAYWHFGERPAVVDEPSPAARMASLLIEGDLRDGNNAAFSELFEQWGRPFQPTGDAACIQARRVALRCLYFRGSWNTLRLLDRPAIITLNDSEGGAHQAVITGIARDHATLDFGGRRLRLRLADLDPYFSGNMLVLWQPPPDVEPPLGPGSRGNGVRWLKRQLGLAADSDAYTQALADAVRRFQAANGLTTDGIAGARTLAVLLGRNPDRPGPHLGTAGEED